MKTSAKGIYSETLQSIIDAKLGELVKKRDTFETRKREVLEKCTAETNEASYLQSLLDGVKHCFQIKQNSNGDLINSGMDQRDLIQLLVNLKQFLQQPRYDMSISRTMLANWKASLMHELDAQSARYEYASLYARLVTEWLAAEQGHGKQLADGDHDMAEDFEQLESTAKLESRQKWEEAVFTPFESRVDDISALLDKLFGIHDETKEKLHKALKTLRSSVSEFETELVTSSQFDEHVIRWCIDGLVASGRLDNSKLQVLKDFRNNTVILAEVADVLNLRLSNIDSWTWGESVPVEQRRRLAGFYSNVMNEDLLQAIFLQYIGTKWSVFFRQKLAVFVDTDGAWVSAKHEVPTLDHQRRQYYLGTQSSKSSVQSERHRTWRTQYFLSQLPRTETQLVSWKDGDEEANHGAAKKKKAMPAMAAARGGAGLFGCSAPAALPVVESLDADMGVARRFRRRAPRELDEDDEFESEFDNDDEDEDYQDQNNEARNLMDLKQRLLHLLKTEALLNVRIHDKFAAFRGQFEKWDSMLPHATIMTVLSFLGVSQQWQTFFTSFLEAPLSFNDEEPVQNRRRGVPENHPLSDVMGEVVLFCLDLLVNQECQGSKLWRVHDDFWFWSSNPQIAGKAWFSIGKFAQLFGVPLDINKAGSVQIGSASKSTLPADHALPKNPIRWGFLYLDAKSGDFNIDQDMVDEHVAELKRQLQEKTSKGIISWIQAWNAYAINFFSTNFGKPAVCFGPGHMEKILVTLDRMQKQVFDGSDMVQYITNTIQQRYNVSGVPDGYVYFPTQAGGLDLRNPFIMPILLEKVLRDKDPVASLDEWQTAEKEAYERAKKRFDKQVNQGNLSSSGMYPRNNEYTPSTEKEKYTFFTFDEFTRYREEYNAEEYPGSKPLSGFFKDMLEEPQPGNIILSKDIAQHVYSTAIGPLISNFGGGTNRDDGAPYWLWVCEMYGPEILKKFAGLNIVDPGVLPIGMVDLLKGDRVEWN